MMTALIQRTGNQTLTTSPRHGVLWWKFTVKASSFSATTGISKGELAIELVSAVTASSPTFDAVELRKVSTVGWVLPKTSAAYLGCAINRQRGPRVRVGAVRMVKPRPRRQLEA